MFSTDLPLKALRKARLIPALCSRSSMPSAKSARQPSLQLKLQRHRAGAVECMRRILLHGQTQCCFTLSVVDIGNRSGISLSGK